MSAERLFCPECEAEVRCQECGNDALAAGWLPAEDAEALRAERDAARAEGVRLAVYECGWWCGECEPSDADDDCCVLPAGLRAALAASEPAPSEGSD